MPRDKVTYEGSKWPALLSRIDPTRETTVLRPLLAAALMLPLSQLPLSYNVGSLPLRIPVPNSSSTPSEWNIPVTTAMSCHYYSHLFRYRWLLPVPADPFVERAC